MTVESIQSCEEYLDSLWQTIWKALSISRQLLPKKIINEAMFLGALGNC